MLQVLKLKTIKRIGVLMVFNCLFFIPAQAQTSFSMVVEDLVCYAYSYNDMKAQKPLLVLVHGSPGSHSDWNKYLKDKELGEKYRILAIDRAGYGSSIGTPRRAYVELDFQAKVVALFIRRYAEQQQVVLLGHSLGGPIVSLVSAQEPTLVQQLVLLAPAISPKYEQPRWYNRLAAKPWFNRKLPIDMKISQEEMMHIVPQLEILGGKLSQITCPTYLLHGRLDMIAPYGNARYVQSHLVNAPLDFKTLPFRNHFIHITKFKYMKHWLLTKIA